VYESQRQASKCVYVRSRLGIDGCFATHFHNFTRNKKDICQGLDSTAVTPDIKSIATAPPMRRAQSTTGFRLAKVNTDSQPRNYHGNSKARTATAHIEGTTWKRSRSMNTQKMRHMASMPVQHRKNNGFANRAQKI
jgi:hypothetical protein